MNRRSCPGHRLALVRRYRRMEAQSGPRQIVLSLLLFIIIY